MRATTDFSLPILGITIACLLKDPAGTLVFLAGELSWYLLALLAASHEVRQHDINRAPARRAAG